MREVSFWQSSFCRRDILACPAARDSPPTSTPVCAPTGILDGAYWDKVVLSSERWGRPIKPVISTYIPGLDMLKRKEATSGGRGRGASPAAPQRGGGGRGSRGGRGGRSGRGRVVNNGHGAGGERSKPRGRGRGIVESKSRSTTPTSNDTVDSSKLPKRKLAPSADEENDTDHLPKRRRVPSSVVEKKKRATDAPKKATKGEKGTKAKGSRKGLVASKASGAHTQASPKASSKPSPKASLKTVGRPPTNHSVVAKTDAVGGRSVKAARRAALKKVSSHANAIEREGIRVGDIVWVK